MRKTSRQGGRLNQGIKLCCLFTALVPTAFGECAVAQAIRADGSLSTQVGSSADGLNYTIDEGDRLGPNLFHSFSDFSVPSGGSATFTNDSSVANIVSRITGTSASSIDGLIQANGVANLFLLNSNGVVFGPGAQLQIGGSFVGSTAERIAFEDGTVLDTKAVSTPMLTVSAPTGLQLGASSGAIRMLGAPHKLSRLDNGAFLVTSPSNLAVAPGRTIALVGGEIELTGGRISTTAGRIELGSVETGQVDIASTGVGFDFNYDQVDAFSDIQVSQALVDAISPGGGLIQLQGKNISVVDGSEIAIQNQASVPSAGINIQATDLFTIAGGSPILGTGSGIRIDSLLGSSGDIDISARNVLIDGGLGIESLAILAPGGNVTVEATESVLIQPSASTPERTTGIDTLSFSPDFQTARAGDLSISADRITLLDGSNIASLSQGSGDSGNVDVTARLIEVEGVDSRQFRPSIIGSGTLGAGNAGNLLVNTEQLFVRAGGRIDSSTATAGNAGSVTINATERVSVSGRVPGSVNPSLIVSAANILDEALKVRFDLPPAPTGDAGDLTINTPVLSVADGAQVTVRNDGSGRGGILQANVGAVRLDDAGITASTLSGEGGNIQIVSSSPLIMTNGSLISAEAGGRGDGGNITIDAPFLIALENSDIVANAVEGDGGTIEIMSRSLIGTQFRARATDRSDITASSQFGVSGNVEISNPETDPSSGTVELPADVGVDDDQITAGCSDMQRSRFVASGRGGLPPSPESYVDSRVWQDVRALPESGVPQVETAAARQTAPTSENEKRPEPVIEAADWTVSAAGDVVLRSRQDAVAVANMTNKSRCLNSNS